MCHPQVQHYVMTVQAQDAGKPMLSSTVTVYVNVIDENDNAPVFETNTYNVDIYENATVNTVVATVMATDRDSGKHVTYYINRHWRLRTPVRHVAQRRNTRFINIIKYC